MDEISQEIGGKDLNIMSRVDNGSSETTQDEECIPQKKLSVINEIEAEPNVSTNGIDIEETKPDNFENLIDLEPSLENEDLERKKINEMDVENNLKDQLLKDNVENLLETGKNLNQSKEDVKPNNGVSDVEKISDPVPVVSEEDKPLILFDDEDLEKPKSSVSVSEQNCTDKFISILDQSLSVFAEGNQNDKTSEESKNKSDNSDDVEMINVSECNAEKNLTSECEKDIFGDEEKRKSLTSECEKDIFGDEEKRKSLTSECEKDIFGDEEKRESLTSECEKDIFGAEEKRKSVTSECEKDIFGDEEKKKSLTSECEKNIFGDGDEEKRKSLSSECEKNIFGDEEKSKSLLECETDVLGSEENCKSLISECEKDVSGDEEKCDNEPKRFTPEETENENFLNGENQSQDQLKTNEECKDNLENFEEDKTMETELVSCDDICMDSSRDGNDAESHDNPSLDHDKQSQVNLFEEMEIDELNVEKTLSVEKDALEESEKSEPKELEISDDKCTSSNNEVETITGDTNNQNQKERNNIDEEICIIPDDVGPRSNVTNKDKDENLTKEREKESEKTGEKSTDLLVTRGNEKRREYVVNKKTKSINNGVEAAKSTSSSEVQTELVAEELSVAEESNSEMEESSVSTKMCAHCKSVKICKFQITQANQTHNLCSDQCHNAFKENLQPETELNESVTSDSFGRKCSQCRLEVVGDDKCLSWETMDFCNEDCLGKYQNALGSYCANCKLGVASASMGKYCVRFGYEIRQFCSSTCLEEYKKGLKFCSYCQKDISTGTGFLAPVGDQGQFKDFCEQSCMEKYERMGNNSAPPDVIAECAVCSNSKPVRVEVELDNKTQKLCSEPCFAAFKFVNNIREGQCDMCKKYFDRTKKENFSIYYEDAFHLFCCKTCMNVYILANRKIVPCNRCKVKKYNFDMIKKINSQGQILMMCSLNCLMLYQKMIGQVKCDFCATYTQSQYHLTMSDGSVTNFCGYTCVISFQNRFPKQTISMPGDNLSPVPTGGPKRVLPRRTQAETPCVPVISSVQSLAASNSQIAPSKPRVVHSANDVSIVPQTGQVAQVAQVTQVTPITQTITLQSTPVQTTPAPQVYQQIITKPPPPKEVKNKAILCKPYTFTKGVSCRPHPCMKETQTDESLNRKCLIPIPVPIFVPAPMHMYASPYPVPVPFPLPVPVPIFIPTTRNSAKGIFKEIKKIQEKIPTDPFEAELLMMAEMVAGDKKQDPTDSESDEGNDADEAPEATFSPENVDTSNTFGEDMLQMALKMASELEEPAVDMESVLTSNTITPTSQPPVDPNKNLYAADPDDADQVPVMMNRGRKRAIRGARNSSGSTQSKRGRRTSGSVDVPMLPPPEPVPPPRIEIEKPDANMCLKYTFGVNAWRHWVMQKNAELEKVALTNRKIKLFKPELLQLTADELNFSLCLFVKEVRKPNGTEYAPDTIYYLCLGIQQYLFENGRIDNIFTDSYYEKFTDCLDEVAKKFAALYNDSQYIVTRVEEEHLWESKQLGAHSPHVLLSTLMFFNTKHFNLVTVEEHMQLSFSHIMKHWKRNPNAPGVAKVPGSRNVLLRFYPPQSALEANSRKKKVYEQQENEENPLRCPVKLYEFYLSKCPESVKTRNDVFYLLPERSCVPDSPVWYSTMALGKEPLMKMLHRVKMVKEINIALLTC